MTTAQLQMKVATALLDAVQAETYTGKDEKNSTVNIPYDLPEVTFDPATNPRYIVISLAFNVANWESLSGNKKVRQGLLQFMVTFPKNNGIIKCLAVASAIEDAWGKGRTIYGNGFKIVIDPEPWVGGQLSDASRVQFPVNIPWKVFAN